MRKPSQKPFIVQSIALSVSVLILSVGCSTGISNPPNVKTKADAVSENDILTKMSNAAMDAKQRSTRRPEAQITNGSRTQAEAIKKHIMNYSTDSDDLVIMESDEAKSGAMIQPNVSVQQLEQEPRTDTTRQQINLVDLPRPITENTEKYQKLVTNPVIQVADQSTSTFSIDVDTGAYSNVRRFINAGTLPPADAVRVEELLNYFSYDYATPESTDTPFSIHTELASSPWNTNTRLLHIGLKGYNVDEENRPPANLVFLIDVSGSMADANKLGLLKSSIKMMTKDLNESDRVSIVVYAGASGVVLEPTAGNDFRAISGALKQLNAGGSTNGEAGIELAYSMAEQSMNKDSINRIILATDGDFNVGINNIDQLKKLIEQKRQSGIALTTLGFGTGNYNDHLMEQLSNVGNGSYAYIDTLNEARKVLSEELTSTLLTIAKDVKIQIEFNPAQVSEYRLLGYVNRRLANEDFANDKVDAGEIGAGHTVTALYEIALTGEGGEWNTASRYQATANNDSLGNEIAEVRLRFKQPDGDTSELITRLIKRSSLIAELSDTSDNFRFSAAVAGFGQLLRQNKYLTDFGYTDAAELASAAKGTDRFGYRTELVQLIDLANSLDQQNHANMNGSTDHGPKRHKDQENEG